jgi:hypothetical protein
MKGHELILLIYCPHRLAWSVLEWLPIIHKQR